MARLYLVKRNGALWPCDEDAQESLKRIPENAGVEVEFRRVRNLRFHRKFFALLRLAFDLWEPPEGLTYRGEAAVKNFERFRKDVLILSGHYTTTVNLKGEIRLEASSISFANIDEDVFTQVYEKVLDTVWNKILKSSYKTKEEVDEAVEKLLTF